MKAIFLLAALLVTTHGSAIRRDLSAPVICPLRPCIIPANCENIIPGDPDDPCACPTCGDDTSLCEIEGQEYTSCGTACPPTCANPGPSICARGCVKGCQCPAGTVLDEVANKCVQVDDCTCPPECTKDFCTQKGNENAQCSVPGPREIPGCTGQCPLTYCGACYFAKQVRSLPKGCGDCGSPISSLECLEVWADCIHNADVIQYGEPEPSCITQEKFKCYRYPCMLRG